MVGLLFLHYFTHTLAVEHIEHIAAVGHLHCGSIGVLVAGDYLNTQTLELDSYFLAELSAA